MAALDSVGAEVRAIDVGRVGSLSDRTFDKVIKAVVADFADRRLAREWAQNPPDVTIGFDPAAVAALAAANGQAARGAPVLAVVPQCSPAGLWRDVGADRYLAIDEHAAAELGMVGVPDDRVVVVGPIVGADFASAGKIGRMEARSQFGLGGLKERIVLVSVEGMGSDLAAQLAFQLSMVEEPATYLFAAGQDNEAARALRSQVPALELSAKLFGDTDDAPKLWRSADVIVTEPTVDMIARAVAFQTRMVCLPGGDSLGVASVVEERGLGVGASSVLMLSSALAEVWKLKPPSGRSRDGAGNVADVAWLIGENCTKFLAERNAASYKKTSAEVRTAADYADAAAAMNRGAGDLEDLSSIPAAAENPPSLEKLGRLRLLLEQRREGLERTMADASKSAKEWDERAEQAEKDGSKAQATQASRKADLERARMHKALADMAALEEEMNSLEKAEKAPRRKARAKTSSRPKQSKSTVDDMLRDMKKGNQASSGKGKSVDEELEALKKRAKRGKRK